MKLIFPNPSRSFDDSAHRVRFWGYDRASEVAFFVESGALRRLRPNLEAAEAGFLQAFDEARSRIEEVAEKVYGRGSRGKGGYGYVLTAADF
ncbi:MAG: DUF1488 domain-containing protein [Gammaproteobacteria bacterium]|nr:DUF1488 domain-containing protein [Gammaproteobacteria bacterium]